LIKTLEGNLPSSKLEPAPSKSVDMMGRALITRANWRLQSGAKKNDVNYTRHTQMKQTLRGMDIKEGIKKGSQ
jgi:hypothetical protein